MFRLSYVCLFLMFCTFCKSIDKSQTSRILNSNEFVDEPFYSDLKDQMKETSSCFDNLMRLQISRTSIESYKTSMYLNYILSNAESFLERSLVSEADVSALTQEKSLLISQMNIFTESCKKQVEGVGKKKNLAFGLSLQDLNESYADDKMIGDYLDTVSEEYGREFTEVRKRSESSLEVTYKSRYTDLFTSYGEVNSICGNAVLHDLGTLGNAAFKVGGIEAVRAINQQAIDLDKYYQYQTKVLLDFYLTILAQNDLLEAAQASPGKDLVLNKNPFSWNQCTFSLDPDASTDVPHVKSIRQIIEAKEKEYNELKKSLTLVPVPSNFLASGMTMMTREEALKGIYSFCGERKANSTATDVVLAEQNYNSLNKSLSGVRSIALMTFNLADFTLSEDTRINLSSNQGGDDSLDFLEIARSHCLQAEKQTSQEALLGIPDLEFWRKFYVSDYISMTIGFIPGPIGVVGSLATDIIGFSQRAIDAHFHYIGAQIAARVAMASGDDKKIEFAQRDLAEADKIRVYMKQEAAAVTIMSGLFAVLPNLVFKSAKLLARKAPKVAADIFVRNMEQELGSTGWRFGARSFNGAYYTTKEFKGQLASFSKNMLDGQDAGTAELIVKALGERVFADLKEFMTANPNLGATAPLRAVFEFWETALLQEFGEKSGLTVSFLSAIRHEILNSPPEGVATELMQDAFFEVLIGLRDSAPKDAKVAFEEIANRLVKVTDGESAILSEDDWTQLGQTCCIQGAKKL